MKFGLLLPLLMVSAGCTVPPPSPEPTSAAHGSAEQVIAAFRTAGLEVRDAHAMTADDLITMVPDEAAVGGIAFNITSDIDPADPTVNPCRVRVHAPSSPEQKAALLTSAYNRHDYDPRQPPGPSEASRLLWYEWVVERDNILLHVSTCASAAKAAGYAAALDALR